MQAFQTTVVPEPFLNEDGVFPAVYIPQLNIVAWQNGGRLLVAPRSGGPGREDREITLDQTLADRIAAFSRAGQSLSIEISPHLPQLAKRFSD